MVGVFAQHSLWARGEEDLQKQRAQNLKLTLRTHAKGANFANSSFKHIVHLKLNRITW
jgi:hypothetical protein